MILKKGIFVAMFAAVFIIGSITILSFDGGVNRNDSNPLPLKWRNVGLDLSDMKILQQEDRVKTQTPTPPNTGHHMPDVKNEQHGGGHQNNNNNNNKPTNNHGGSHKHRLPRWKSEEDNPFNKIDKVHKKNEKQNMERALRVREAMKYCWDKYREMAWGHDELHPLSKSFSDWFGLGLTIVDSLDTLKLMGLETEYAQARDWVATELQQNRDTGIMVSVFETIIRFLGSYLTTYQLTGEKLYLDKAEEMGELLLHAFPAEGSPFPASFLSLSNHRRDYPGWTGHCVILSEVGTIFLEFNALSQVTGNPKWKEYSDKVVTALSNMKPSIPGLLPVFVSQDGSRFCNNHISVGAMGDSYYEYLLKMWIYQDGEEERYSTLFQQSADAIITHLYKVNKNGDGYITNMEGGSLTNTQEHLTCFAGGMFALAAASNISGDAEKNRKYMEVGEMVTKTCAKTYLISPTGLGPESAYFEANGDIRLSGHGATTWYLLRPETVESLFILYRLTGDVKYQNWAWQIFEAIESVCKTENGYTGLKDINNKWALDDNQQSFFMAETLKYLYLIFQDSSVIPLDEYVFNTEAHPLKINRVMD